MPPKHSSSSMNMYLPILVVFFFFTRVYLLCLPLMMSYLGVLSHRPVAMWHSLTFDGQ